MNHLFPTTSKGAVIAIKAAAPPSLPGYVEREATETEQAELAAGRYIYDPAEQTFAAPPLPTLRLSKLKIRRVLRQAGLEASLDGYLSANPEIAADWNDAQELWSSDPVLIAAIPAFAALLNKTPGEITTILSQARI